MARKSSQNAPFGGCNFSKSKGPKMRSVLPLSGAQRRAVKRQTSPIECWCEVLMGTTLGHTKAPQRSSKLKQEGRYGPKIQSKCPFWGLQFL
jgi:hypothetical protein